MFTFKVRLAPRAGSASGNLTTEVRAMSDTEARRLAEAQYPNHRVEFVQRISQ